MFWDSQCGAKKTEHPVRHLWRWPCRGEAWQRATGVASGSEGGGGRTLNQALEGRLDRLGGREKREEAPREPWGSFGTGWLLASLEPSSTSRLPCPPDP